MTEGRRLFLGRLGRNTAAIHLATSYAPTLVPVVVDLGLRGLRELRKTEREKLSEGIKSWQLPTGEKMIDLVPGAIAAADILASNDLSIYSPYYDGKIEVAYNNQPAVGSLDMSIGWLPSSEGSISFVDKNGKKYDQRLIKDIRFKITIDKSLQGTKAELVLATKEAMHVIDLRNYAKAYKKLLEDNGGKFKIETKSGERDEDQIALSIAFLQSYASGSNNEYDWFKNFTDDGTLLRVGAIMYANWWLNYPQERERTPKKFRDKGDSAVNYLNFAGVVTKPKPNIMVWKNGKTPEVNTEEFAQLYSGYSGAPLR